MAQQHTILKEVILRDLDIQWKDHFHMRDQTWKTLTNTILFFLGTIGLEFKNVETYVMVVAYVAIILVAFFGFLVAAHHRIRQEQKFSLIEKYEELLDLKGIKEPILKGKKFQKGLKLKVFTARFIELMELLIALVAIVLLIRTIIN
jgi:Ca2+/Na+ antiporter